jgi:hypothetical protein
VKVSFYDPRERGNPGSTEVLPRRTPLILAVFRKIDIACPDLGADRG